MAKFRQINDKDSRIENKHKLRKSLNRKDYFNVSLLLLNACLLIYIAIKISQ